MYYRRFMALTKVFFALLACQLVLGVCPGYTQDKSPSPELSQNEKTLDSLDQILRSIELAQKERKDLQRELETPSGRGREEQIVREIEALSAQLNSLEKNFREIASGIDAADLQEVKEEAQSDWTAEVRELLSPLIDELKRLTSRPRELSELRTAISDSTERLGLINQGIENLESLIEKVERKDLTVKLTEVRGRWQQLQQSEKTELSIAQQKLRQREAEAKPLLESLGSVFDIFFRSRGRNLLLACFLTFLFWYSLRHLYFSLQDREWVKSRGASRKLRLVNVLYLFFSGVGSLVIFMFVLFFFGDWLLLVVAGMLLLGLLWSSRQMIPAFWGRASLLLDMGPVREGERIVLDGIAWKVGKINFFTTLRNPSLDGGYRRLPLQDLQSLRSRPAIEDTVWFPTSTNDWVVLSDGTFGKIVSQGVEYVRLVEQGNSYKTFSTSDFVGLAPRSLMQGFRHTVTFGIDYKHQAIVTSDAPQQLQNFLIDAFAHEGIGSDEVKIRVEFAEAGASSLNLAVLCDFQGTLAARYQVLRRSVQRYCVDACNKYEWGIPFEQLTVHMANA